MDFWCCIVSLLLQLFAYIRILHSQLKKCLYDVTRTIKKMLHALKLSRGNECSFYQARTRTNAHTHARTLSLSLSHTHTPAHTHTHTLTNQMCVHGEMLSHPLSQTCYLSYSHLPIHRHTLSLTSSHQVAYHFGTHASNSLTLTIFQTMNPRLKTLDSTGFRWISLDWQQRSWKNCFSCATRFKTNRFGSSLDNDSNEQFCVLSKTPAGVFIGSSTFLC